MSEPWFKDGLNFTCTQCGKCCTGEAGFVWVTDDEIQAIADFREEPEDEVRGMFTRKHGNRVTLREKPNGDCVFYDRKKGCTIYPVRPPQCRTWPFWETNLETPEDWERTERDCPGSGQGELISVEEILARMKVMRL